MGMWTLVWVAGGSAVGPLVGGVMLAVLGAGGACAVIIALGIAGAALFAVLRTRRPDPEPVEERAPALDRAAPAAASAD
jgi:hypothetical protein